MTAPDFDLVVAGGGGGLVAALHAAESGANVLVVEADEHFQRGNNTSMCTAMIPAAGTRWQHAAGVQDSPDRFLGDITRKTGGTADQRVARALTDVSAALVSWLADVQGLDLELVTDFRYPGHTADRCHTIPGRHGSRLLRHLVERVRANPRIELIAPMALREVDTADGRVTGVEIATPDGRREHLTAAAVLLATNGFGGDRDLVHRHMPEIADAHYHGGQYSRGDALRIGRQLGADAGFLDAYQGHAALSSRSQTLVGWATVVHGGVIVDGSGRRFAPETTGYSEFAALLAARPGSAGWIVIDEHIEELCSTFDDFRTVAESGSLIRAATATALAERIGVPAAALEDELTAAHRAATGTEPDRQGRTDTRHPLTAPYTAIAVKPALFHTQSGLVVDEHARVLAGGTPIPGLYAAGGAAVGISGHGAGGYLAGNGLLSALGLAFLAAAHVSSAVTA
ncbi:FAD-dependent oxidoreductase [Rhodococcus sp. SGAir0479]|uniref:FAD-dependent oxidoreductase n=1 Tax=Rhodococcus sp. SGAir0479 TaxID=2567884 RepID=UPI0010CD10D0|nr:FAD-binding protein [Rhodococcus sp. SGAir0479]QCQ90234.1 FAD-binding protein [Rhodococcus sp. SGAir0479]